MNIYLLASLSESYSVNVTQAAKDKGWFICNSFNRFIYIASSPIISSTATLFRDGVTVQNLYYWVLANNNPNFWWQGNFYDDEAMKAILYRWCVMERNLFLNWGGEICDCMYFFIKEQRWHLFWQIVYLMNIDVSCWWFTSRHI